MAAKKHIMITVCGRKPFEITQGFYALTIIRKIRIEEIIIITTTEGERVLSEGDEDISDFVNLENKIQSMCDEKGIPLPQITISVIKDQVGNKLKDVFTPEQISTSANHIISLVKNETARENVILHCISGSGRRIMSTWLFKALVLVGSKEDKYYHIYINDVICNISIKYFHYPTKELSIIFSVYKAWYDNLGTENPPVFTNIPGYFEENLMWIKNEYKDKNKPNPFNDPMMEIIEIPIAKLGERYRRIIPPNLTYSDLVSEIEHAQFLDQSPIKSFFAHEELKIVGQNKRFLNILKTIKNWAEHDIEKLLILGETGTGKEKIARYFFKNCNYKKVFIAINCADLPESLLESELFGYSKGTHSTAFKDKIGLIEQAAGGILFFDEINSSSLSIQAKLLRFLQEKEIRPIGGVIKKVDVLVLFAMNEDPAKLVETGKLRRDFYARIKEFKIIVPPLRERKKDIQIFVNYFIGEASKRFGKQIESVAPGILKKFIKYDWPGNVRELEEKIKRAVIEVDKDEKILMNLPTDMAEEIEQSRPLVKAFPFLTTVNETDIPDLTSDEMMKKHYEDTLHKHGGNVVEAAEVLDLKYTTFRSRLDKLGVQYKK